MHSSECLWSSSWFNPLLTTKSINQQDSLPHVTSLFFVAPVFNACSWKARHNSILTQFFILVQQKWRIRRTCLHNIIHPNLHICHTEIESCTNLQFSQPLNTRHDKMLSNKMLLKCDIWGEINWPNFLNLALYNYKIIKILTYLLTPYSTVILEKLTGSQLVKKFPTFYGTRRFITTLTSASQLFLFWSSSIQSISPHLTFWRTILILSSHLCLGLPSGLFPSGFPTKTLYAPLLSPHTCYMPSPSHSSWFYHPNNIGRAVWIIKLLIM